jgi:hypothetical protein
VFSNKIRKQLNNKTENLVTCSNETIQVYMFSQIPIDFTVEQTANADAASSAKGRPICVIDIFMGQSFYN